MFAVWEVEMQQFKIHGQCPSFISFIDDLFNFPKIKVMCSFLRIVSGGEKSGRQDQTKCTLPGLNKVRKPRPIVYHTLLNCHGGNSHMLKYHLLSY